MKDSKTITTDGIVHEYSEDWPPLLAEGLYWYKQSIPFIWRTDKELDYPNWVGIRIKARISYHNETPTRVCHSWWGDRFGYDGGISSPRIQEMMECGEFIKIEPPDVKIQTSSQKTYHLYSDGTFGNITLKEFKARVDEITDEIAKIGENVYRIRITNDPNTFIPFLEIYLDNEH